MRCSCSFPQASTASINGTVRDQADAVIQNASVALQVQVSQKLTVDAVLKAGSSTTTVTVTDATPLVNVTDGGPAEEGETIAEVGGVTLTRLRLNSLARAFIAGFLTLDFSAPDRICRLYNNARCSRQRPSVFIMPHWGKRRTVVVAADNRKAIELAAQSAREAGAEVVVEAEAVGLMCAVAADDDVQLVASWICGGWNAYEKEHWPRRQTAIEKQVLELAARKQG